MVINKVEISGVNTSMLPVLTASEKEELIKKIVIISFVGVVVLIGEYFYFKNIQHNVKQIGINVENTQNTNTENEEQTINNTNIQLNEQINTINTNTQINEQY